MTNKQDCVKDINLPLYSAAAVRAIDRAAIDEGGIDGYELMCRAGERCWQELRVRWPAAHRVGVVCGAGNNGGDGFVIGRLAVLSGCDVDVYLLANREQVKGDAARALAEFQLAGGSIIEMAGGALPGAVDVWVDAMLGTGFKGTLRSLQKHWVFLLNRSNAPVLAVDVPSGLDADTGAACPLAVNANLTVTFVAAKQGLYTGEAREYVGELVFDDLAIPRRYGDRTTICWLLTWARAARPVRRANAHKGHSGHVLLIGGDAGFGGAILMAAEACMRAGAGLTSVVTRPEHVPALLARRPEIMVHGVALASQLRRVLPLASVVVVGPGLGRGAWSQQLLQIALASGVPMVLDADALNLIAEKSWAIPNGCIISPHPGEAARLLACSVADVQADRFAAAAALSARFDCHVILKGSGSVLATPGGGMGVCPYGNAGMASGGMGDVLSGVLGALLAQGLSTADAARTGMLVHSLAADRVVSDSTQIGLAATDLIPVIRQLLSEKEANVDG